MQVVAAVCRVVYSVIRSLVDVNAKWKLLRSLPLPLPLLTWSALREFTSLGRNPTRAAESTCALASRHSPTCRVSESTQRGTPPRRAAPRQSTRCGR